MTLRDDIELVEKVAEKLAAQTVTLYAAQIICPCRARLGLVERGMVNTATCANCGRVFQMMSDTKPAIQ